MSVSLLRVIPASLSLAALGAIVSCSGSHATGSAVPPPRAEFLLSSADSTFWVNTTGGTMHVRGVPMILARLGDRFVELYSADQDQSYDDALLVGERLYRRDIVTGDSTMLFADTAVSHVAAIYARTHPDERPLEPGEEGEANPRTSATAELDILEVFGAFLSYEYHVDIELPGRPLWHTTRRGVLDMRTGKTSDAIDVFGARRGREVTEAARKAYETARDSAVRARGTLNGKDRRALSALERRQFDPHCFSLETVDGRPAITFGIPGAGEGTAGNLVELEPITVDSVGWWPAAAAGRPRQDSLENDHWVGKAYTVVARYDTAGETAHLYLIDSSRREWSVGSAMGPLRRVDWLDNPAPTDSVRTALRRAFDQAARYDESARVAMGSARLPQVRAVAFRVPRLPVRHARSARSSVRGRLTTDWSNPVWHSRR